MEQNIKKLKRKNTTPKMLASQKLESNIESNTESSVLYPSPKSRKVIILSSLLSGGPH